MTKPISRRSIKYNIERLRMCLKHSPSNIDDTIAIFGTPRSGTTWLMEMMGSLPDYLSYFEPFHPGWFSPPLEEGLQVRPFIHPERTDIEYNEYLRKVFQGRVISNAPHFKLKELQKRLFADKVLVKFIRANRILPWILNNFELRGSILIIRHPCATIASQFNSGITGYFTRS